MIFLFSLPIISYAQDYNDVSDGEIISFEESSLKINVVSDLVRVTSQEIIKMLLIGECDTLFDMKICLKNVTYDFDVSANLADMNITSYDADIDIDRSLKNSNLYVGVENSVMVKIKNEGIHDASDVNYEERFPENFKILDCENCVIDGNAVIFDKDIKKGGEDSFEYSFKILNGESYVSTGKMNYVAVEDKELYSEGLAFNPKTPFDIDIDYGEDDIKLGEETSLKFTFTNLINEELDFENIILYVPANAMIKNNKGQLIESGKIEELGSFKLFT